MKKFNQKVVFITGASSGIGADLAREFVCEGANVVLTARRKDRLMKLAKELNVERDCALPISCDVTQAADLKSAVSQAKLQFGKIDVVVANAGFGVVGTFENLHIEDYRRQFETNVFGVLNTIYSTLEELKKNKGSLVLMGSIAGHFSSPWMSAYSMSKFAVRALSSALTEELRPHGVSVTLISPGLINTEFRKVDNLGKFHEGEKWDFPKWLYMPSSKAGKQILQAIFRKKREKIITFHGKILVFIQRHFPWILLFLMRFGKYKPRSSIE